MRQKVFSILALLLMAVSGAWAQEETLLTTITATSKDSYSETTAGVVTVTHDNSDIYGEYGWVWWANPGSITVEAKEGYTITRCVFRQSSKTPVTVSTAPFKVSFIETANPSHPNQKKFLCQGDWNLNMNGVSSIEVYGYAPAPAASTYSVTLAEGTEDFDKWTISPTEAAEGSPVTVTYSGEKKVKSVKAVKKAAEPADKGHALSASAVGDIVGSDGKAYAVADKDNLPSGVTAVAMVAYKSGSNGLAIQLNSSPVEKTWADAKTYAEGLTAVPGGTWRLPSMVDWQNMFLGCAVSGDATSADDTMNPIAGFKAKIAATGITWKSFYYWSSTEHVMGAWSVLVRLDDSNAAAYFDFHSTSGECTVLGCLAF